MSIIAPLFILGKKLIAITLGIFGINFIIAFHEFGHYLFCKLFNIGTPSFSIGFGPAIISKKIGDTNFKLSAIPLGGYVEIAGSAEFGQGEQKDAQVTGERSFATKPYYQKFLVMMGGIAFNLLFAYFAIILLFLVGMPKRDPLPIINSVFKGTPAFQAGLTAGDKIEAVNGNSIENSVTLLKKQLNQSINKNITLTIERQGTTQKIPLTVQEREISGKKEGVLGVVFKLSDTLTSEKGLPFLQAVKKGISFTNEYIMNTIYALKNIFTKGDMNSVGGPILIISETIRSAGYGFKMFLFFLAIISISLAILNLIPLPILDGGQLLFYTIEAIIGKPLSPKIKEYIHIATWLLLLALIAYLSFKDIKRIIATFYS